MINLTIVSNVAESLSEGMKVIAQGMLISRKWTDKQGRNRERVELKLTDIGPCLSDDQVQAQKIAHQPPGRLSALVVSRPLTAFSLPRRIRVTGRTVSSNLKGGRVTVSTPYPSFDPCRKKQRNQAAFTFLREWCAGSGIFVFTTGIAGQSTRRKLDPDEFCAFALIDDYAPLIFINHNDSSAARLFSLAHELVHLWLGKSELYNAPYLMNSSTTKMEAYCNKVASEILIPDKVFLQQWASDSDKADGLQELEKLAEYFCASLLAIAHRALDHGFIGQQDYDRVAAEQQERWEQVSRERVSAGGGDSYRTNLSRIDSRFLERLASSVAEGRTTYSQASHLMGMKWTTLAELAHRV
ncbi:ImmA/IrrE family metallo-endopeptidase [Parascardovia denticolens]|nr:ImmA/IrrE family metallo-endopeptidase [Parascardovia denticolens]